ncbi:MAG TPA: ABC transporter substrate-binding protein [Candidatus Korarchaeota archaeon]|nr:ABC transporter substrate-binding protein [Candidatus Korarchaeota archaeon]
MDSHQRRLKRLGAIILLAIFMLFLIYGLTEKRSLQAPIKELSLVWSEDARTLDPLKADDSHSIELIVNVFDRLLRYGFRYFKGMRCIDPERFLPSLAESFEILDGGKSYVFKLRKDMKFHDGTPVTSKDVKYSLEKLSLADSKFRKMVDRIEIVDPFTVKVSLRSPNSLFLHYICSYKASIVKRGSSGEIDSGTGPYKIVEWKKGEKIVLEAVKSHYLNPKFDKVKIDIVKDPKTIEAMLLSGEATGPSRVPLEDLKIMAKSRNLKILEASTFDVVFLILNCRKNPFNNTKVRRAFASAVPCEKIGEVAFDGFGTIAKSVVPENLPEHNSSSWMFSYNITEARKQLLQSGTSVKVFSITVPLGDAKQIEVSSILQIAMYSLGLDLVISQEKRNNYDKLVNEGGFQVILVWKKNLFPDSAEILREIFWNETIQYLFYSNKRLNELISRSFELSGPSRKLALFQAQRILAEEVPVIPILYPTDILLANKAIEGYVYYPDGALRYWELHWSSTSTNGN